MSGAGLALREDARNGGIRARETKVRLTSSKLGITAERGRDYIQAESILPSSVRYFREIAVRPDSPGRPGSARVDAPKEGRKAERSEES